MQFESQGSRFSNQSMQFVESRKQIFLVFFRLVRRKSVEENPDQEIESLKLTNTDLRVYFMSAIVVQETILDAPTYSRH